MERQTLSTESFKKLAVIGAQTVLERLEHEAQTIKRTFPELAQNGHGSTRAGHGLTAQPVRARRKGHMSASQRKAVSLRMRKYWQARRDRLDK